MKRAHPYLVFGGDDVRVGDPAGLLRTAPRGRARAPSRAGAAPRAAAGTGWGAVGCPPSRRLSPLQQKLFLDLMHDVFGFLGCGNIDGLLFVCSCLTFSKSLLRLEIRA